MPKSEPIQSFLSFNEAFEYACELVTAWARIEDLAYPKVVIEDSQAADLRRDSLVFKADMDALQKLCEEFIAEGHKRSDSRVRLLPSMKDAIAACEGLAAMLTPKQSRFVEEYMRDSNATQAYIRAGYSERTANKAGPKLLVNLGVSAAIRKAIQERSDRTSRWVIER